MSGLLRKRYYLLFSDLGCGRCSAPICRFRLSVQFFSIFALPVTHHHLITGNSRRPEITQTNLVDIFVFYGDSLQPFIHYRNVPNPTDQAGYITAQVNDTWFGTSGQLWSGQNVSMSFYWVLIRSDQTLDGSEILRLRSQQSVSIILFSTTHS